MYFSCQHIKGGDDFMFSQKALKLYHARAFMIYKELFLSITPIYVKDFTKEYATKVCIYINCRADDTSNYEKHAN